MQLSAQDAREYWRGVLVAGGVTTVPRWAIAPVAGVGTLEATVPEDVTAALPPPPGTRGMPLSSLLLTAHAKVVAALTGDVEVTTGYVGAEDSPPLPCPLAVEPGTWRSLVLSSHRAESDLLAHQGFPVEDLRRDLGLPGPSFETVFDPHGDGGALVGGTVLRVGFGHHRGRLTMGLRHRTDVLDGECAQRIAGYHLAALALLAADAETEHGQQSLLSTEEVHHQLEGLPGRHPDPPHPTVPHQRGGPAGPHRALPDRRFHELFEEQVRLHPDTVAAVHGDRQWTYREL